MVPEYREGIVERWAGTILRWLMAYLFLVGAFFVLLGILNPRPGMVFWGLAFAVPYLVIRWRDEDATTLPFVHTVK